MNAVSRFEPGRPERRQGLPRGIAGTLQAVAYALGGALAMALIFQLFFRYQYLENGGILWRVDRLTQQMCQVRVGSPRCTDTPSAPAKPSTSTSTSTSTSLSLSVKVRPPKAKPH